MKKSLSEKMFSFIVLSFYLFITDGVEAKMKFMPIRREVEKMPDYLKEELVMNSYINSMSMSDDRKFFSSMLNSDMIAERDINFLLYTSENPIEAVTLKIGDFESLRNSSFSNDDPTKILIHGWSDTGNSPWVHDFRKNYLQAGDYNVIVVDWSVGSLKEYLTSARLTRQIGDYVSQFLEFLLVEEDVSVGNIHILGHSLGAHVAGIVGNSLSGKIARITGMDPARPNFEAPFLRDLRDRLDPSDANFVDVVHTCAGTVGFIRPIGHADFYPNGGSFRQPGCSVLLTQSCSHSRVHDYVGESIINPVGFPAVECSGWREFKSNKCDKSKNQVVFMGEKLDPNARGVFFLETNVESPFGRGDI